MIQPLDLTTAELLPPHLRSCVFWEIGSDQADSLDGEFEKEAWLSRVLLEWGECGQLAIDHGRAVGAALYAPPRMVPGAARFPTAPASADAVLLTALHQSPTAGSIRTAVLDAVIADLRRRGITALEAFGHSQQTQDPSAQACGEIGCMTSTAFLLDHGFTIVAHDPVHPRLRLKIDAEHQWKSDVERALEHLLVAQSIPATTLGPLGRAGALVYQDPV